jgi:Tfp pilus assembly protein PilV
LIEVLVSLGILAVGLLGVAGLISSMLASGTQARYMNVANVLASEQLDNLNKWPSTDQNVCDSTACADATNSPYCSATSCGTLAGSGACTAGDPYCDQVTVSETSGADYETQTQVVTDPVTGTSTNQTTTIVHTNAGCVGTPTACGVPNPSAGGLTFTRRWLITTDPTIVSSSGTPATVTGARRVTVVVSLVNESNSQNPVTFQMSMVRP